MRFVSTAVLLTIIQTAAADVGQDVPVLGGSPGVVSHVNVLSDKVPDMSSLEAWKQAFIKPDMTDQQKALAIWRTVVTFRHQDIPPNEYLEVEDHAHDPIECFNVYGYGQCCCASANVEMLARYIGLDARGWGITGHSVPEIKIGGNWCMFDASLINYFRKADGSIAGVEEIGKDITQWNDQHPDLRNNDAKLRHFMPNQGWKNGPQILAGGTGYDGNGWLPAATHGWYNSMQEFGHPKSNFIYDYGCAPGYELNIQLRPGEKLIRNWSNKGLHVNMLDGGAPGCLNGVVGQDQLRYSPAFGDLAPGRIGNGTLEYDVPLADPNLKNSVLHMDALETTPGGLAATGDFKPGVLVLDMPSSYVYLGGKTEINVAVAQGGAFGVSISQNNGLDWKLLQSPSASGNFTIDLKPLIFRRYDYRLKFELSGRGTVLQSLRITGDIQHSQRVLPALDKGDNHIRFAAGAQEGTITVEGLTDTPARPKNLLFSDFHPILDHVDPHNLQLKGGNGEVTIPIETPGDLTRLRIGAHYRARDPRDGWTIDASFDEGKTWQPIGKLEGPHAGYVKYLILDQVPSGAHKALVRFTGTQRNTTLIQDLRISADYRQPHGGFAPVKVSYAWEENGQLKSDTHIAHQADETYDIHCEAKPLMKSISLELAQ